MTCNECGHTVGYDCDCFPLCDCEECGDEIFASEYIGTDRKGMILCVYCRMVKAAEYKMKVAN